MARCRICTDATVACSPDRWLQAAQRRTGTCSTRARCPSSDCGCGALGPGCRRTAQCWSADGVSNLCARGVEVGDLVAVLGHGPRTSAASRCPDPTMPTGAVAEDRRGVLPSCRWWSGPRCDHAGQRRAYDPESVSAAAARLLSGPRRHRAALGGFLVLGTANYLHRVITAPTAAAWSTQAGPAADVAADRWSARGRHLQSASAGRRAHVSCSKTRIVDVHARRPSGQHAYGCRSRARPVTVTQGSAALRCTASVRAMGTATRCRHGALRARVGQPVRRGHGRPGPAPLHLRPFQTRRLSSLPLSRTRARARGRRAAWN